MMRKSRAKTARSILGTFGPAAVLTAAGFLITYQFVDPAPPSHMVISAGDPDGAYYRHAQRYRAILAREGITLEVRASRGSIENLERLADPLQGVQAAFVQGGTGSGFAGEAQSLGSLYFEPLWVFHRGDAPLQRLPELRGRRIAIGAPGSGTRALVTTLLEDNGLTGDAVRALPLGGRKAVDALADGSADAAFFVTSADSPLIREMLGMPGIHLMDFERAEGWERRHRFLSAVNIPVGAVDMGRNIPPVNTRLLAPTANLVVRPDLHPALVSLLVQAADEVHGPGGWFEATGRFPSPEFLEFPLSPEARRFYRHGPPLLQRYLPFWAASLVDRTKILLLPLFVLLVPLIKLMPPLYAWRMRSRVYRWYRHLEKVDDEARAGVDAARARELRDFLDRLERDVDDVEVPLAFAAQLYMLRQHIELVRRRLEHG